MIVRTDPGWECLIGMILPIHVGRHQLHLVRLDSYKTIDCELQKISVLWPCEKVVTKQKYAPSNFNLEKGWGFEYSNQCKTLLIFAKFEHSSKNPFHTIKIPFRVKKYFFLHFFSIIKIIHEKILPWYYLGRGEWYWNYILLTDWKQTSLKVLYGKRARDWWNNIPDMAL